VHEESGRSARLSGQESDAGGGSRRVMEDAARRLAAMRNGRRGRPDGHRTGWSSPTGLTALVFAGRVAAPRRIDRQGLDERAERLQHSDDRERNQSDDDHEANVLPPRDRLKRSRGVAPSLDRVSLA